MHTIVASVTAVAQGYYKAVLVGNFPVCTTLVHVVQALSWSTAYKAKFHVIGYN